MKDIIYSNEARERLLSGFNIIGTAVKTTLGPSGRNVLIKNDMEQRPFSTKDGVTVAGQVHSDDSFEQIAIESVQDIANNTDAGAGDGTTTATVIAEAIFTEGLNFPEHLNLLEIKKGMDETVALIVQELQKRAIPIQNNPEKLKEVALIASNYDKEISELVYDAFKVAGRQGIVNIKRSQSYDSHMTSIEGMTLPTGFRSKYYINAENETCILEHPWIYSTDKKISKLSPNLEYLLTKAAEDEAALLIICPEMDYHVSEMIIRNVVQGSLKACVARTPGFGNEGADLLSDLGTILGKEPFIENVSIQFEDLPQKDLFNWLPRASEVVITENTLSVKEASGVSDTQLKQIAKQKIERADLLRAKITKTMTQYEKSVLQARISRLSDGIAFINIGSKSNTEFLEKQARLQDALYAIKSANEEGIIPGGGTALLSISKHLVLDSKSQNESMKYGSDVVMRAIRKPFFQIIENVTGEPMKRSPKGFFEILTASLIFFTGVNAWDYDNILSAEEINDCEDIFNVGFNAKTKMIEGDMIKAGIIDPVKVTRVALESAASISGMLLTTECVILNMKPVETVKY